MDRYFDPGAGSERSWQDGDEPDPFALGDDAADDGEGDEEESSSLAYGSLMSLGGSLRKKQPCIVIDADEAEQGMRLVQHAASHQFGSGEDADVALRSHDWQAETETQIAAEPEPETMADELPLTPAALEPWFEAGSAAEEPQTPEVESAPAAEAMPLLPSSEPESMDDSRLGPPPVFEYRNGLRRKLVAAQATATRGLRLVQLLRRIRRWAMRLRF
jgi:hypothetical protein